MDPLSLFLSALPFIGLAVLTLIVFAITKEILSWRRVVPVNMVHIIQTGKRTISYGANLPGGNVYYANTEIGAKLLDGQTEPAKPNGATN